MANVRVVATGKGFDGIQVRNEGDEFDMPESVFDKRTRKVLNASGQVIGEEAYPAPSWFKKKEAATAKAAAKQSEGKDLV